MWNSLSHLVLDLELGTDPGDPVAARGEVVRRLGEMHPDKTGGAFSTPEAEVRFRRLIAARDYIDNIDTALVRSAEMSGALGRLERRLQALAEREDVATSRKSIRSVQHSNREQIRLAYRGRKIGSATFGSVCAAMMALGALPQDSLLGKWASDSPTLLAIAVGGFAAAGLSFLATWWGEQGAQARAASYATEHGMINLFSSLVRTHDREKGADAPFRLSRTDLVAEVMSRNRDWAPTRWARWVTSIRRGRIPAVVAEDVADTIISELLRRGVLREAGRRGLEMAYELDEGARRDVASGPPFELSEHGGIGR